VSLCLSDGPVLLFGHWLLFLYVNVASLYWIKQFGFGWRLQGKFLENTLLSEQWHEIESSLCNLCALTVGNIRPGRYVIEDNAVLWQLPELLAAGHTILSVIASNRNHRGGYKKREVKMYQKCRSNVFRKSRRFVLNKLPNHLLNYARNKFCCVLIRNKNFREVFAFEKSSVSYRKEEQMSQIWYKNVT
jgi:hypothetical protein